jgi:hypothetical protein
VTGDIEEHHEESPEDRGDQPRCADGEADRQQKRPAWRVVAEPSFTNDVSVRNVEELLEGRNRSPEVAGEEPTRLQEVGHRIRLVRQAFEHVSRYPE